MTRIIIRSQDGGILGWFDPDRAAEYREATEWDGSNHISVPTGQQGRHQSLYRTSGGRWVLEHYSNWQGEMPRHEYISDEAARAWLILNERDEAVEEHFGAIEEERGPGRPVEVGGKPINVRLGEELLAAVDRARAGSGQSRADLLRDLVAEALSARQATARYHAADLPDAAMAQWIADMPQLAGNGHQVEVDAATITLTTDALAVLADLPDDTDGHYDGSALWVGGMPYEVRSA